MKLIDWAGSYVFGIFDAWKLVPFNGQQWRPHLYHQGNGDHLYITLDICFISFNLFFCYLIKFLFAIRRTINTKSWNLFKLKIACQWIYYDILDLIQYALPLIMLDIRTMYGFINLYHVCKNDNYLVLLYSMWRTKACHTFVHDTLLQHAHTGPHENPHTIMQSAITFFLWILNM